MSSPGQEKARLSEPISLTARRITWQLGVRTNRERMRIQRYCRQNTLKRRMVDKIHIGWPYRADKDRIYGDGLHAASTLLSHALVIKFATPFLLKVRRIAAD